MPEYTGKDYHTFYTLVNGVDTKVFFKENQPNNIAQIVDSLGICDEIPTKRTIEEHADKWRKFYNYKRPTL